MGDRHARKRKRREQSEMCANCSQRYDCFLLPIEGESWPMYPLRCIVGQLAHLREAKLEDMSSCLV